MDGREPGALARLELLLGSQVGLAASERFEEQMAGGGRFGRRKLEQHGM